MRRLIAIVVLTALAPVAAWRGSGARPAETVHAAPGRVAAAAPEPCDSTTTTTAAPSESEPCETTTTEPPTTDPSTTAPTTTAPSSTLPGETSTTTTTPDSTSTSTPSTESSTTTTTTTPDSTSTSTPSTESSTTTTTTTPESTSTTTTTTVPPRDPDKPRRRPDDPETDPKEPPAEVPSGRVVVPGGKVDPGQLRSITFPVAGPVSYFNDFGACRDGCSRAHKGNDIIGDRLQPIIAMHDGVIDHLVDHETAGYGVVIRDSEGWEYRVYHMNNDTPGTDDAADSGSWRFAPGIVPGTTVTAGQFIGWMGDSGNSEGSVPHAHVEIHRPDGNAINPYWSLRLAQRDVNCAAGTPRPTRVDRVLALTGGGETAEASGPAGAGRSFGAAQRVAAAAEFLAVGWQEAALPGSWLSLELTGGNPGSGDVDARMWVGPAGYTPVDATALQVGDPRYDQPGDCDAAEMDPMFSPIPAELGAILATIRTLESGGDYSAASTSSSASGAYQFVDSTWGGYGGYARAKDAPPSVQDAKALEHANQILLANNGDVSTVPVSWYIGHVPVGGEWDSVPAAPGNVLTPREYQARWLQIYSKYVMSPTFWASGALRWAPQAPLTCRTVVTDLGPPGEPEYVLTQARAFRAGPDGRALVRRNDPCDPTRPLPAKPETGLAELTTTGGH